MDTVDAAVKHLNSAASKSGAKDKKLLVEMAGQASTHLVLLKLSSISEQVAEKLCNFFRASFFALYAGLIVPTLRLVSAIFETVYHERILSAMGSGQAEQKARWESVLHALLGGVLDFLDDHHTTEAKDAIGDILLPTLSDICFSLSAPRTSVDLRCTGYNILIDSAALHQENQEKLRDSKVLGGERLGSCIWRTKDYLALECLLNLFARILPSTNASTSGRERRTAFIQSVFLRTVPPESSTTAREITDLLERVSSSDWDETSLKLVNAMARGSIIHPQPFDVNEVVISGTIYPSDRLYADDKTFLINVVLEEDQYESLEIAYTAISKIRLSRSSAGRIHVILSLISPPRLGKNLVEISIGAAAGFSLSVGDECRLIQALKSRGLAEMVTTESPMIQKLSIATEPAKLEIDSAGRLVKEPTQHERIENLSQFYRTDEKSDDIISAGDWEAFWPIEITSSSVGPPNVTVPGSHPEKGGRSCDYAERSASPTKSPPGSDALNLTSADSKLLFDAAFGTSDDDLSEFTDEESPLPRSKTLRRTSTTTSIPGRISFQPAPGKATLQPTRLARGGVGKVVLDSDDEAPPAPAQKKSLNAKKALIRAPTMDTVATEDRVTPSPGPEATITSDVSTLSSKTNGEVLVPATTSGRRSTTSKVLRFSDVHIPAPDFNAALSSPPTVPTSTLKSALVKKPPNARSAIVQESSPSPCISAATAATKKSAAVKVNDVLDDLIPASSSPTPGAKLGKVSPRKNNQPIADLHLVQHVKRKAATVMDSDDDDDVPLATRKAAAARSTKRARSSPGNSSVAPKPTAVSRAKESSPKQHSDQNYPALRPPMHPRRRYHARKGRTSSPQPTHGDSPTPAPLPRGNFVDVDYDELPTSPPRRSAASGAAGKSSSPPPKTKLEPVKKDVKAKDAVKDEGVGKAETATKQTREKKTVKPGNTIKAEKAIKPIKAEKNVKADVGNTSPENPAQRVKAEALRAGTTAQKDNTASKVPTTTKTRARRPGNSAKVDELVSKNDLQDEVAANGPPRAPPRPRRAGAGAAKAKQEGIAKPAIVNAPEPDSVEVSPPSEIKTAGTDKDTSVAAAADAYETADIGIVAAEDTTSSGILEFLDDIQPLQPEIAFSDPSIVGNSTEVARSSSSKSAVSRPRPPKLRPVETPWDAMAQRIQQPPPCAPDSPPRAELVTVLAKDHAKVPALSVPTPVDCSTATYAKFTPTFKVDTLAGKRETAVQTTGAMMSPTLQVERKPIVIDLTLDSSPEPVRKPVRAKVTPVCSPHKNLKAPVSVVPEDALGLQERVYAAKERLPQPVQHSHIVRFTSSTEPPSMHGRSAFGSGWKRERSAEAGDETLVNINCGSGDPGLDAIVDVLNKLHQVVVESIASKFEGVRQEVRAGRDELLRFATADLHTLHAQSVTHFNKLIDLEAEYATVGRNVLYANEDWVNVNQQACDTLAATVEKHDRVTEALSKVYYRGLPSAPPLIATTKPCPYQEPTGPEAYTVLKELRVLGDHPLASVWDNDLADRLRHGLNTMRVNWTSIDVVRIVEAGESSGPAIVWIGVESGALNFEEGSVVARNCRTLIDSYDIPDYHVEIRESSAMKQTGNGLRFLDPVPLSDPTFAARDPYTATLGIPLAAKDCPGVEGTGGFYLSAGGDDRNIYLVTARHVVLPVGKDDNQEYEHRNHSAAREDIVVLGTSGFNEKLAAIDNAIECQNAEVIDALERMELVKHAEDLQSVREREDAERQLEKAKEGLQGLQDLRREIATNWSAKERRIFGELVWAPPIAYSTEAGQYTLDLAVIKIDEGTLDANNYRGNAINIGNKYTRHEFQEKVRLHDTCPESFKFKYPADRLVTLHDQVPETDLAKPPMLDRNGDPCLIVFKNGASTGTTIGKANNVSSFTRTYFAGQYRESREWPVLPTDLDGFSKRGDSGSCVADVLGRIGGILTGGCACTPESNAKDPRAFDITYVTPISLIMKTLHGTERFVQAHLNPTLA